MQQRFSENTCGCDTYTALTLFDENHFTVQKKNKKTTTTRAWHLESLSLPLKQRRPIRRAYKPLRFGSALSCLIPLDIFLCLHATETTELTGERGCAAHDTR